MVIITKEERFSENTRLVAFIINKHFKANINTHNILYEDLISEGRVGLWKACLTYDETMGYKFSTYASQIIYFEIIHYISRRSNLIRPPRDNKLRDHYNFTTSSILYLGVGYNNDYDEDTTQTDIDIIDDNCHSGEQVVEKIVLYESICKAIDKYKNHGKFYKRTHTSSVIIEDYIWSLYYGDERYTQDELSKKYKVSQVQISRWLTKFKDILKDIIEDSN